MFKVINKDTLLLTWNMSHTFFSVSIADFEQLNVCWVGTKWVKELPHLSEIKTSTVIINFRLFTRSSFTNIQLIKILERKNFTYYKYYVPANEPQIALQKK